MSGKSSRKAKPKAPPPRAKDAIEQDYGRAISQAGQAQYQVSVYQEELKRMNEHLRNLNYEAAARNQLDRQEAEPKAAVTPAVAEEKAPA